VKFLNLNISLTGGRRPPKFFFSYHSRPCPKTWRNRFPLGGAASTRNHAPQNFKPPYLENWSLNFSQILRVDGIREYCRLTNFGSLNYLGTETVSPEVKFWFWGPHPQTMTPKYRWLGDIVGTVATYRTVKISRRYLNGLRRYGGSNIFI